ncbi:MAG: GNAT family N-acetyltransferase [Thermoplasmata archaeon]
MAAETHVRFATEEDKDWCKSIDSRLTDDIFWFKVKHDEMIVGEIGGERVGYLRLEYWYLDLPFVGLIIVDEEHRNKGVGKVMLTFLEEHLVKSGYDVLYSSSDVGEPEPQAWHRHMGFNDCGVITGMNENGASEVIFKKDL